MFDPNKDISTKNCVLSEGWGLFVHLLVLNDCFSAMKYQMHFHAVFLRF